jgi:uncharacterized protein (TIGR02145 family)
MKILKNTNVFVGRSGKVLYKISFPAILPGGTGALYNKRAVDDPRGIAPSGWHVPSRAEFELLIAFAGGGSSATASRRLREVGFGNGTDDFKFSARAGGLRSEGFFNAGAWGYWYSSDDYKSIPVTGFDLGSADSDGEALGSSGNNEDDGTIGMSVRLIKDDSNNNNGYMIDNDGNIIPTITIGNQVWARLNLYSRKFRNGDSIPEITDNDTWAYGQGGAIITNYHSGIAPTWDTGQNKAIIYAQGFTTTGGYLAYMNLFTQMKIGSSWLMAGVSIYNVANDLPTTKICDGSNMYLYYDTSPRLIIFPLTYLPAGQYCFVISYSGSQDRWDYGRFDLTYGYSGGKLAKQIDGVWSIVDNVQMPAIINISESQLCAYNNDWLNVIK